MLFCVGILDFVFMNMFGMDIGYVTALGVFIGVVALGVGSFLLIFELGQWKNFIRVWLSATAIIKWGATLLVLAMVCGFVNFLFYLPPEWNLFWYPWTWLRNVCCAGMMFFGICVVVYTGVLLSTMKPKSFWNTPALPVLFTVSGLSTATALLAILAGLWPGYDYFSAYLGSAITQMYGASYIPLVFSSYVETVTEVLHIADSILVLMEIVVLLLFVLGQRAAGNTTAKAVAKKWLTGSFAGLYWVGMIVIGTAGPFLLYRIGGIAASAIAPVCVLAAGVLLRFLVVYSDQRRPIPGEERYYSRIAHGDEQFLQPWKTPY
jgi:polysulfide reductase chain C